MSQSVKALREKRAALAKQANDILSKATNEKRSLTAEESAQFDAIHADVDALKNTIDAIDRQAAVDDQLAARDADVPPPADEVTPESRSLAFKAWAMHGSQPVSAEQRAMAQRCGYDVGNDKLNLRALGVATAGAGLNTVPTGFQKTLEQALLQFGGMRDNATILKTDSGSDLPYPTVNDTAQKGVILGENTAAAEQDVVFGQLVLKAFKYSSKMIRVSVELLQDSAFNLEDFLGRALGERIGRITNDHFTTGAGTTEPKGIVTAATSGKVGTTGQTTSVIYADLVDLQHSVDPAYRSNAAFMLHDSTLKAIKKLVDSQGRPLWSSGVSVKEPDTILGSRYIVNQSMPVMAANAKSILYGDVSKYLIRDVSDIQLVRLDQRFGEFHQVAFLAFSRHDGNLLDAGTNPVKYYANSAT